MPLARYRLVDIDTTPYYHCMVRCVRRAYLCGDDRLSGNNFDHRKQWILDRVKQLSSVFAVDVCAYAIMANHYHLVLHLNIDQVKDWSNEEVIDRWTELFRGSWLVEQYRSGQILSESQQKILSELVEVWRNRLADLSWFMRCLNEHIARLANAEDKCTGRFWEGRFKSQALLDKTALMTCMAYVDLNPIRAGLHQSLEGSDFTSIQERLKAFVGDCGDKQVNSTDGEDTIWLEPFTNTGENSSSSSIPMQQLDYFALLDWTGRSIRGDKRGAIPDHIQPILDRLGVNEKNWAGNVQHFGSRFYRALGRINQIRYLALKVNVNWLNGMTSSSALYK